MADDGFGQRVLRASFNGGCDVEDFAFGVTAQCDDLSHFGAADCQRPRLVESDGL